MKDDIPDSLAKIGLIILCILIGLSILFIGWAVYDGILYHFKVETRPDTQTKRESSPIIIDQSFLKVSVNPVYIHPQVLGIMMGGLEYEDAELLNRIITCESGWRNICNQEYGCDSGMGVAMLIPSTVKYCEEKLGKSIDPLNEEDSLECASWLLENEGAGHWGCATCDWGSWHCWNPE